MIRTSAMFAFAIMAYLLGTVSLLYVAGFIADFGVPKGISDGPQTSVWLAVLLDTGLVGLFGVQHSIAARASFKRWWTQFVPRAFERATYLCMTAIMTGVLVYFWRPIPITLWHVRSGIGASALIAAYVGVWMLMCAATFSFGYFHFFGLAQAWRTFVQSPPSPANLSERYLYAFVRHPISVGWMTAPLLVPHLTVGHLVFATATALYILIATPFEEADLLEEIGAPYAEYCKRVPRFVPSLGRRRTSDGPHGG